MEKIETQPKNPNVNSRSYQPSGDLFDLLNQPEELEQPRNTLDMSLFCWNSSKVNDTVLNVVRNANTHIVCLQEVRQKPPTTSRGRTWICQTRGNNRGGGVAIGLDPIFSFQNKSYLLEDMLEVTEDNTCDYLFLLVSHQEITFFLLNIYINRQNLALTKKLSLILQKIRNKHHQFPLIACGDFNQQKHPIPFLYNLSGSQPTRIGGKGRPSKLDWVLASFDGLSSINLNQECDSDHLSIKINLKVPQLINLRNEYRVTDRKQCLANCEYASLLAQEDFNLFVSSLKEQQRRFPFQRIVRCSFKRRKREAFDLDETARFINQNLRTADSVRSFKKIKQMTILNPDKRDGGFINCIFKENEQDITSVPLEIQNSCLEQLYKLQTIEQVEIQSKEINLPNLSKEQIEEIQKKMSNGKGMNNDGIPDIWIKNCQNYPLLAQCWNWNFINQIDFIFDTRICLLNKVWPQIPLPAQFRPIAILSHLIKFIELRFYPKLMKALTELICPEQVGFVPGMSCQVCIKQLIELMIFYKNKDKKTVIFIDYSQAYNSVNRQILYRRLKDKKILSDDEIEFLRHLHDRIYFKTDKKFFFKNGVHQGSPISPALFNIYLDIILEKLKEKFGDKIWLRAYADDLVIVCDANLVQEVIDFLHIESSKLNLKINPKKSKIMPIKRHNLHKQSPILLKNAQTAKEIECCEIYEYLGVKIDPMGGISKHLNKIKSRTQYLHNKTHYYAKKLEPRNNHLLWTCYIKPYFDYVIPFLGTQSKTLIHKFCLMLRTSYKQYLSLPKNLPQEDLCHFMENNEQILVEKEHMLKYRINLRFPELQMPEAQPLPVGDYLKINQIPINFLDLFRMQNQECNCTLFSYVEPHRLTLKCILKHSKMTKQEFNQRLYFSNEQIDILIKYPKKYLQATKQRREENFFFIESIFQQLDQNKIKVIKKEPPVKPNSLLIRGRPPKGSRIKGTVYTLQRSARRKPFIKKKRPPKPDDPFPDPIN